MTLSRMDKRKALQDSLGNETFDPREKRNEELENQFKFFQQQSGYENISDNLNNNFKNINKLESKQQINSNSIDNESQKNNIDDLFKQMEFNLNISSREENKDNNFGEQHDIPNINSVNNYSWLENSVINRLDNIDELLNSRIKNFNEESQFVNDSNTNESSNDKRNINNNFDDFLNFDNSLKMNDEVGQNVTKKEDTFNLDSFLDNMDNQVQIRNDKNNEVNYNTILNNFESEKVNNQLNQNENTTRFNTVSISNAVKEQNSNFESFFNAENNETVLKQTNTIDTAKNDQEVLKYANDNTFNFDGVFDKLNEDSKGNDFDFILNNFESEKVNNQLNQNENTTRFNTVSISNAVKEQNSNFESFFNAENNETVLKQTNTIDTAKNEQEVLKYANDNTFNFDGVFDKLNEDSKGNDFDFILNNFESEKVNNQLNQNENTTRFNTVSISNAVKEQNSNFESFFNAENNETVLKQTNTIDTAKNDQEVLKYANDNTFNFDGVLNVINEENQLHDFNAVLNENVDNLEKTLNNEKQAIEQTSFDEILDTKPEVSTPVETKNTNIMEQGVTVDNNSLDNLFEKLDKEDNKAPDDIDNFLNDIVVENDVNNNFDLNTENNSLDSLIEEIKKEDKLNATSTLIDIDSVTQTIFSDNKTEDKIEHIKIDVEPTGIIYNNEIDSQLNVDDINNTVEKLLISKENEELNQKANKKFNNMLNIILFIFVVILVMVLGIAIYYLLKTYAII